MKMSAIASYLLSLSKKTAAALRTVYLILKMNTIDSRKVKGEVIRSPFSNSNFAGFTLVGQGKVSPRCCGWVSSTGMKRWWDSRVNDRCEVDVQVDEWPFPWGSLSWLLRAAGASEVMPEE